MAQEYALEWGVPSHEEMAERLAAARTRLAGVAHVTPVLRSRQLDEACGASVFLKCENLQRMGAFKFRGAWNAITALPADVRRRGVVAYSSGNHAQAVALAARLLGVPSVIVMPSTAPTAKLAATRGYGAEVLFHDQLGEGREALALHTSRERGMTLVAPFDHPDVVAGQGTATAELLDQEGPLDAVIAPVGGAGLLSGTGLAAAVDGRGCRVIGVEPALGDDAVRSFRSGKLESVPVPDTICDGARTQRVSELTLALIRRYASELVTADDAEVIRAMRFLWERVKLVVEPTGALAVAALMAGRVKLPAQRVGVILSGGNVDLAQASAWFANPAAAGATAS